MPFVTPRGIRIYYTEQKQGPVILFLAGSSLGTFFWGDVNEKIQPEYRCVAVDVRGSGRSDAPRGPYSVGAMAGEVRFVLDHLGVDEALLVGHSMGGFVAMEMARAKPSLAKGLVLVATACSGQPAKLKSTRAAIDAMSQTRGSIEELFRGVLDVGIGAKLRDERPGAIDGIVASHLKHPPRGMGFVGQRAAIAAFDGSPFLREIRCTTLVVHGEGDRIILPENGTRLASEIPGAEFVSLEGVGHFPPVEAPESMARAVLRCAREAFSPSV